MNTLNELADLTSEMQRHNVEARKHHGNAENVYRDRARKIAEALADGTDVADIAAACNLKVDTVLAMGTQPVQPVNRAEAASERLAAPKPGTPNHMPARQAQRQPESHVQQHGQRRGRNEIDGRIGAALQSDSSRRSKRNGHNP